MSDKQLQIVAYLYGRCREQLKQCHDVAEYEGYTALSQWLWRILQDNLAVYNGRLKREYTNFMETGRRSVEGERPASQERRVFEVKNFPQYQGRS